MLSRIPESSSPVWCSEPLFGLETANLFNGGPTGDAEIFAIDPDGAGLIRGIHIVEPSESRAPRLAKAKP
jgi:hypothetical protein